MNFNKAIIIGRLTRDPELKTIPSGQQVATISVATNRHWTDQAGQKQEVTEYHNIVAWGKLAEICGQYLKKGHLAMFEGRLQTRSWDGQDGVKRYRTEIVAENMQMGPRAGESASSSSQTPNSAKPEEQIPTIQQEDDSTPSNDDISVDNIPF